MKRRQKETPSEIIQNDNSLDKCFYSWKKNSWKSSILKKNCGIIFLQNRRFLESQDENLFLWKLLIELGYALHIRTMGHCAETNHTPLEWHHKVGRVSKGCEFGCNKSVKAAVDSLQCHSLTVSVWQKDSLQIRLVWTYQSSNCITYYVVTVTPQHSVSESPRLLKRSLIAKLQILITHFSLERYLHSMIVGFNIIYYLRSIDCIVAGGTWRAPY